MANNNKEWYESLFGLIVIGVGLNLFSNFLYDRTRAILEQKATKEKKFLRSKEREDS